MKLPMPTADTGRLISETVRMLGDLYEPRIEYHRAGILLYDFVPEDQLQSDLLGIRDFGVHHASMQRMETVDKINSLHGRNRLHYASENLARKWAPRRRLQSPRYTTTWEELATATIVS